MNDSKHKYIVYGWLTGISVILIGILVMLILTVVSLNNKDNRDDTKNTGKDADEAVEDFIKDELNNITYIPMSTTEKTNALGIISDGVHNMQNSNTYVTLFGNSDGSQYITTILNTKGEAITEDQAGNLNILKNDGTGLSRSEGQYWYGEKLLVTEIDVLDCAVHAAMDGIGTFQKIKSNVEGDTADLYLIDICGFDNIQKMYELYDPDYASYRIDELKSSFASDTENDVAHPNFRFMPVVENNEFIACYYYLYFGEDQVATWDTCYLVWYFSSIIPIGDWQLDDEWYNYDFDKIEEDDAAHVEEMVDELFDNMIELLDTYLGSSDDTPIDVDDYKEYTQSKDSDGAFSEESTDEDGSTSVTVNTDDIATILDQLESEDDEKDEEDDTTEESSSSSSKSSSNNSSTSSSKNSDPKETTDDSKKVDDSTSDNKESTDKR